MKVLKYIIPFVLLVNNLNCIECGIESKFYVDIALSNDVFNLHSHKNILLPFKPGGYTIEELKNFLFDLLDKEELYECINTGSGHYEDSNLDATKIKKIKDFINETAIWCTFDGGSMLSISGFKDDEDDITFSGFFDDIYYEGGQSFYHKGNECKSIYYTIEVLPINKKTTFNDLIDKLNNITSSDGFKFATDTKFKFVVEYPDGDSIKEYEIKDKDLSKFICTWIYPIKIIVPDNCRFEKVSPAPSDSDNDSDSVISEDKGEKTDDKGQIKDNKNKCNGSQNTGKNVKKCCSCC